MVITIVNNGNENKMSEFLSCPHVLPPTKTIPEEDYAFSCLFNVSNSVEILRNKYQ